MSLAVGFTAGSACHGLPVARADGNSHLQPVCGLTSVKLLFDFYNVGCRGIWAGIGDIMLLNYWRVTWWLNTAELERPVLVAKTGNSKFVRCV